MKSEIAKAELVDEVIGIALCNLRGFNGRDIGGLPPYAVARLGFGFVPQERGIFSSLSVRENLTLFARHGRNSYWTLQRVFELFPGLQARERNLGFQLSGGEQQMLSIARALMLDPALPLLDEPTEGLAPMVVQEIIDALKHLKDKGLAILLVEQNLRVALAAGDRHHVMNKGEICFTGSAEELENSESVLRNYRSVMRAFNKALWSGSWSGTCWHKPLLQSSFTSSSRP